jgi:RNA polymerase sigma factor (sigma-70 family)
MHESIHGYKVEDLRRLVARECRRAELDAEDTNDCVQEFLVHVLVSKPFTHTEPDDRVRWLTKCAVNYVWTFVGRHARERQHIVNWELTDSVDPDQRDTVHAGPQADPVAQCVHSDLTAALKEAISELTPDQQTIVRLYYLWEMNAPEIAEVVGRTPQAINQSLFLARRRMRKILESTRDLKEDEES